LFLPKSEKAPTALDTTMNSAVTASSSASPKTNIEKLDELEQEVRVTAL
jgi:hypothetical protein